jgi:hypothetical protein
MPVALNLTKRQPVSQGLTSAKPPKHAGGRGGGGGETLRTRLTKHKKSYAYTGTGGKKLQGRLKIFRTFPKLPEPKTICEKRCIFLPICTNLMRAALPFNYNFEVQLLNFYVHTDCPIKKYCSLRKQLKSRMNERISKQKNMKFHKK